MTFEIRKAVKYEHKLRLGLGGPTGSGKTYTMLRLGTEIAKRAGGRLGVIDTEHGTASLYADEFDFDVIELASFAPDRYIEAIHFLENSDAHAVIAIDSLSHAWIGKDGELEQVDKLAARNHDNSFIAWRHITPQHNNLVEALVGCKKHLIATMRSKMAYELVEDKNGKKKPEKLGMSPVMRDGIEYEFDLYAEIAIDHTLEISKTRCNAVDGYRAQKAGEDLAGILFDWAKGGADAAERPAPQTSAEEDANAQRANNGRAEAQRQQATNGNGAAADVWGDTKAFLEELTGAGFTSAQLAAVVTQRSAQGGLDLTAWRNANPDVGPKALVAKVAEHVRSQEEAAAAEQPAPPQESAATPPSDSAPSDTPALPNDAGLDPEGECSKGGQHEPAMDNAGAFICTKCEGFLASPDAPGDVKQEALLVSN